MRNNQWQVRELLQLFDVVVSQGTKAEGVYKFQHIRAWSDFDGYTCWLAFNDLTITLLFHGKLSIEYEKEETLSLFSKKMNTLIQTS